MSATSTLLEVSELSDKSGFWGSAAAHRRTPVPSWIFVEHVIVAKCVREGVLANFGFAIAQHGCSRPHFVR
jgi:hypothetical protein